MNDPKTWLAKMLLGAYMKLDKKNLGKQLGFYMKLVSGALIPF